MLFGKKKKGDFFLEIDENQEKATSAKTEAVAEVKAEVAPAKTEVVAESKPETPAKPASKKSQKTSITKKKKVSATPVASAKPAPVVTKKVVEPTEVNFATEYILPVFTAGPRRRPGPSLNPFLSMASEMKVPSTAK
jgi:hypothetical protein